MKLHKILLLVWVLILVSGLMGLVYTEISFQRTATAHIGPIELHHPESRSIRIPRSVAVGLVLIGSGMTVYTTFFKLR